MHEGDRNRSLSNSRGYTFDVAGADVTDSEHSGQAGFKEMWRANKRPMRRSEIVLRKIRPGLDEATHVERNTAIKPARIGYCASHDEDMADLMHLDVSSLAVPPTHSLQTISSFKRCDFGV